MFCCEAATHESAHIQTVLPVNKSKSKSVFSFKGESGERFVSEPGNKGKFSGGNGKETCLVPESELRSVHKNKSVSQEVNSGMAAPKATTLNPQYVTAFSPESSPLLISVPALRAAVLPAFSCTCTSPSGGSSLGLAGASTHSSIICWKLR